MISRRARRDQGLERAALRLTESVEEERAMIRAHLAAARTLLDDTSDDLAARLAVNAETLAAIPTGFAREHAPWDFDAWSDWAPGTATALPELRLGSAVDRVTGEDLGVPVVVPVRGGDGPIIVLSRTQHERAVALGSLESMFLRAAVNFGDEARLVLLGPVGTGGASSIARHLPGVVTAAENAGQVLDELEAERERIETTLLDRFTPTIDSVPGHLRLGERRHFVFVAELVDAFDAVTAQRIKRLATAGGRTGIHVIVHVHLDEHAPTPEVPGGRIIEVGGTTFDCGGVDALVQLDGPAPTALRDDLLLRLRSVPRPDDNLAWSHRRPLDPAVAGTPDAAGGITAIVGRAGDDEQVVSFGPRAVRHAVLLGPAAVDRRGWYDSFVASLLTSCPAASVRVRLVDGRGAAGLAQWRGAPQVEAVLSDVDDRLMADAIAELHAEVERRRASSADLPVLLALLDGLDDRPEVVGHAAPLLRAVLDDGPEVGVHVVLGLSSLGLLLSVVGAEALGRFDLRVVLPSTTAVDAALALGISGQRLATRVCDRPGRAVVNAAGGHADANTGVRLYAVTDDERNELIAELQHQSRSAGQPLAPPLVVSGVVTPTVESDIVLGRLADAGWDDDVRDDLVRTAASGREAGGTTEGLRIGVPGQAASFGDHAHLVLHRAPTENVAIVIDRPEFRLGAVMGVIVGSVLSDHPTATEVVVVDRGAADTPSALALATCLKRLDKMGVVTKYTRANAAGAEFLAAAGAETQWRHTLSDAKLAELPTMLVVLHEPDRIPALQRVPTASGSIDSELGVDLRYTLMQGPTVGVHLVVAASSGASLRAVVSDASLAQDFRHRLAGPLPQEESFAIVRSSRAARLSGRQATESAVLFDSHTHASTEVRPFSATAETSPGASLWETLELRREQPAR